jgi:hypothetical protein
MLAMQEEIGKMSREEKLLAMEWLWESLAKEEEEPDAPAWHGEVLAKRRRLAESGQERFVLWEEAEELLSREVQ